MAICSRLFLQIYVDDPIVTFDKECLSRKIDLGVFLLWTAITVFPIKLEKSDAGLDVKWIGARLKVNDQETTLTVTIPAEEIEEMESRVAEAMKKPDWEETIPVIGWRTFLHCGSGASHETIP